jgi:hypothetical protein
LDKAYDAQEADELLEKLGYTKHIKRQGQSDEPGIGEVVYPARRWKVERSISWLNNMGKLAGALGEEGGELPRAVVVSRCAHHLPTDSFGIGSKLAF